MIHEPVGAWSAILVHLSICIPICIMTSTVRRQGINSPKQGTRERQPDISATKQELLIYPRFELGANYIDRSFNSDSRTIFTVVFFRFQLTQYVF